MSDTSQVHVIEGTEQLLEEIPRHRLRQSTPKADVIEELTLCQKFESDIIDDLKVSLWMNKFALAIFVDTDDIWVA